MEGESSSLLQIVSLAVPGSPAQTNRCDQHCDNKEGGREGGGRDNATGIGPSHGNTVQMFTKLARLF